MAKLYLERQVKKLPEQHNDIQFRIKFMLIKKINKIRILRKARSRARIVGTAEMPRLSVFRSNKYISAQLIDDSKGKTLVSATSFKFKKEKSKLKKSDSATEIGEELAKKAKDAGIFKAVFDRGSYKYHGRVKAVCEGARKEGLKI